MKRKYINHQGFGRASTALFQFVNNGRILRLTALHAEDEIYEPGENRADAIHSHPVYHIVLYLQGTGSYIHNHRLYSLQRGTLTVSSPFEPHCFSPDSQETVTSVELTLQLESESRDKPRGATMTWDELITVFFAGPALKFNFPILLKEPETQRLSAIFNDFFESLAAKNPRSRRLKKELSILEIISFIIECRDRRNQQPGQKNQLDVLEQVKSEIEKRFNEPLRLADLAARANLSVSHFARQFKQQFNISPIAYQHQLRMEAARILLTTSQRSITQIAGEAGYSDVFSFSKHFKQHFGRAPRDTRKRLIL